MSLQAADLGGAGVWSRLAWSGCGTGRGRGLKAMLEGDASGFRKVVEEQEMSRMSLWVPAQGLP